MSGASWDDLQRAEQSTAQKSEEAKRFAALAATVFTTTDGKELLAAMRRHTIEKRSAAHAPESVLREDEARRRYVHELCAAVDMGLKQAAEGKPKAV